MSLRVDIDWLVGVLLASVRVASAVAIAPLFGSTRMPPAAKVLLAVACAAVLASALPVSHAAVQNLYALALAATREAVIGAAFGFGLLAAQAATLVAGRALDIQIGFGAAGILNPATQELSPLIGTALSMAFVAVFLALDGHHLLIRALADSFTALPLGDSRPFDLGIVARYSSVMFAFGLTLAAPVMFALWLADISMAVFARSMPQLNVFVLSFAVKVALGLIGLALSLELNRALFAPLLESTFRYWGDLSHAS